MAKNTQADNSFTKMFTDPATNPFAKVFTDLNAPLCGTLKEMATQYIDTSEEWARKALEWSEKATTWAKATPFAPLFETQRSLASQVIENSAAFARSLWKVEPKTDEKTV
jgi:hypothetical protein